VLCAAAHNTYVASWTGMVYVAFVIDVFSRRDVGWRAATDMTTPLVLDALEMALWTRRKDGITDLAGLVHHNDAGSQYTSIAFTQRLIDEGVDASVGSVGDAYDNALAESHMGLYKSELIHSYGPWKGLEHVEAATLDLGPLVQHRPPPRVHPGPNTHPGRTHLLHSPNPLRRSRLTPNEASGLAGAAQIASRAWVALARSALA
jgi:transposase InsO family protein